MTAWTLSEAKRRLSEVLNCADKGAPQVISRRDREHVIITGEDYRKLTKNSVSFLDYLIDEGPRFDDLELMKREVIRVTSDDGDSINNRSSRVR